MPRQTEAETALRCCIVGGFSERTHQVIDAFPEAAPMPNSMSAIRVAAWLLRVHDFTGSACHEIWLGEDSDRLAELLSVSVSCDVLGVGGRGQRHRSEAPQLTGSGWDDQRQEVSRWQVAAEDLRQSPCRDKGR